KGEIMTPEHPLKNIGFMDMNRQGMIRRAGGWTAGRALWLGLAVASASFAGPARLRAQGPVAPVPVPGPAAGPGPAAPGMVVVEGMGGAIVGAPVLQIGRASCRERV